MLVCIRSMWARCKNLILWEATPSAYKKGGFSNTSKIKWFYVCNMVQTGTGEWVVGSMKGLLADIRLNISDTLGGLTANEMIVEIMRGNVLNLKMNEKGIIAGVGFNITKMEERDKNTPVCIGVTQKKVSKDIHTFYIINETVHIIETSNYSYDCIANISKAGHVRDWNALLFVNYIDDTEEVMYKKEHKKGNKRKMQTKWVNKY